MAKNNLKPLSPARIKKFLQARTAKIINSTSVREIAGEAADVLLKRIQTRFKEQTSPDGTKWQESRASIARRKKGSGKNTTLYDSGDLYRSIKTRVTQRGGVSVAASAPYASVHQHGGVVIYKGHNLLIPARPFMNVTKQDSAAVLNVLRSRLNRRY